MDRRKLERLSVFDIFKIGVGPSSSHTLGPWKAAIKFLEVIKGTTPDKIEIYLFGSLSKTGSGHATDIAVMLGLAGYHPETIPTEFISDIIFSIRGDKQLAINGRTIEFDPKIHIHFESYSLDFHPNGLTFKAFSSGNEIANETYFSVGGGFIVQDKEIQSPGRQIVLPYPIDCGDDLVSHIQQTGYSISKIVFANELAFNPEEIVLERINKIYQTMLECVYKGCHTDGVLPGGINVKRRARALHQSLMGDLEYSNHEEWLECIKKTPSTFNNINKWVSCFALAVNEENASLGRVVTSPTNGAAGVIPAVLFYYICFCDFKGKTDILNYFLVAGEIGSMFKKGATISAAEGGCQAEIGVSSAMAAGALTELMGGTSSQVLMAAEIAMEHHLGLTCDPIGGLVQVPCIERNTMGAIKAITASNLALAGDPVNAVVNFDTIVRTMWETAQDMNHKYKETAEGGLAINLPVILPNC